MLRVLCQDHRDPHSSEFLPSSWEAENEAVTGSLHMVLQKLPRGMAPRQGERTQGKELARLQVGLAC